MTIIFQPSYMIAFSTLYFILLTTSTLVAKPIAQNIADQEIDPQSYLRIYGYLEEEEENATKGVSQSISFSKKNDSFVSAIKNYQRSMDLNVTGVADEATKRQMSRPRCGAIDTPKSLRQSRILDDYPNSSLWNKTLRTYRFGSFASYNQISRPLQESVLDDAFYEWSKHVPLAFEKVCQTCPADIVIEFIDDELDNHRDNDKEAGFNRNDLAHAPLPWHAYPAFIHFNKKINFTNSYNSATSQVNLFHIALHEIGHTLGLEHLDTNKKSVMFPYYPDPYDRSRVNYLQSVDQKSLQSMYGIREKTILSSCSIWSRLPHYLNITSTDLKKPQSLSINQAEETVETGNNYQQLTRFLLEHQQWYYSANDHLRQQKNASESFKATRGHTITRSMLQVNHYKSSGTVSENEFGQTQAIFLDRSDNLYVSDYVNDRVLKYNATITEQQLSVVAEHLNAPRGLYVSNDGNTLYVIDSKGVHRFKLNEKQKNLGASSLLFCLDKSWEIYNMIVDEDDFNTIYLYDGARKRIQRCRHLPPNWQCETIIDSAAMINGPTQRTYMVLDAKGDLSVVDSTTNVILHYKHDKNGCQSVSTSIKPPLSSTASPPSSSTPSSSTTARTVNEQKPGDDVTVRYGSSHGGAGGKAFNDAVELKLSQMTLCIGVEVFWSAILYAVRFIYKQNDLSVQKIHHGYQGNPSLSNETFLLSKDEHINKVTLYVGKERYAIPSVMGIQFDTTNGRKSRLYGMKGGEEFTESYEGFILGYAKGRSGYIIDMLQFVWYKQETVTVQEFQHFTASCSTSSRIVIVSAVYRSISDPSCSKDTTDDIREICFNKVSCSFSVRNEILNIDPCYKSWKELQVAYTCVHHQATTVHTSDPSHFWTFDNSAVDKISNLNGLSVNSPSYVISGITGSSYALSLNRKNNEYITISTYKNLTYTSFTVEMWIYPTVLTKSGDYGLFSQRHNHTVDHFLHYAIRHGRLYMGFFSDDTAGTSQLTIKNWYHVAFVYDYPSRTQIVYLNGIQDGRKTPSGPYLGESGSLNIGMTNILIAPDCFNGYISQASLTMRSKSASEILVDATLTAWHSFDNGSFHDSGPLGLSGAAVNVDVVSGRVNQALSFTSNSSYYQVGGFVLLGVSNYSFSISLWVKPASVSGGTLIHLSTTTNGQGGCADLMGFSSHGQIIVSGGNTKDQEVVGPILDANIWTHVVGTFSTTNGFRLYVNGALIGGTGAMPYHDSGGRNILTLANPLQAVTGRSCGYTSIATGVYFGYLDELRVYSRELNNKDVVILANP